jgi:hypothetical protein
MPGSKVDSNVTSIYPTARASRATDLPAASGTNAMKRSP